jgi:putative nucleotidyltransferase-like protein
MPPSHAPLAPRSTLIADKEEHSDDLSARARAWWLTRDPRVLWPALEPSLLQPSADAIGRAVASLLRGDSTSLGSAGAHDAYAIGIAALLTGTGPLLGRWIEEGSLDVSEALANILARHLAHGRLRAERISRGVAPALSELVKAGITPAVIKGLHTAYVYFAEPGLRPMSDVDIVVAPQAIADADEALRAAEFTPSPTIARPYKRDWYPPDDDGRLWSFEMFDARDRWKLELHDGLNFGFLTSFGFRLDGGLHSGTPEYLHAAPVRTPAQPLLTTILAAHLSTELHTRRLLRLVELVYVIRRDREAGLLDWDSLEALLQESGATRFVYPALALVERLVPSTVDAGVLMRGRRACTRLARLVTDRFTLTSPILEDRFLPAENLMWATSGRDLVRYAAKWVNPVPGRPWREVVDLYHSRLRRLLSGRVSWLRKSDDR